MSHFQRATEEFPASDIDDWFYAPETQSDFHEAIVRFVKAREGELFVVP